MSIKLRGNLRLVPRLVLIANSTHIWTRSPDQQSPHTAQTQFIFHLNNWKLNSMLWTVDPWDFLQYLVIQKSNIRLHSSYFASSICCWAWIWRMNFVFFKLPGSKPAFESESPHGVHFWHVVFFLPPSSVAHSVRFTACQDGNLIAWIESRQISSFTLCESTVRALQKK